MCKLNAVLLVELRIMTHQIHQRKLDNKSPTEVTGILNEFSNLWLVAPNLFACVNHQWLNPGVGFLQV